MIVIPLSKGKFAIIDDENAEQITCFKWCVHKAKTKYYAMRDIWDGKRSHHVYLHNAVIGDVPKGMMVDHINGDSLDNRKCNLRLCTKAQNSVNSPKIKGILGKPTSSKYKGVCWDKKTKKWYCSIRINTKKTYLGTFVSEDDAAKAYNIAALSHHGDFATLNEVAQ